MLPQKPESSWSTKSSLRIQPLTVAFALVLGGCSAWSPGAPQGPALAIPAAWSAAALPGGAATANTATASPLAQWWQRFNDPLLSTLVTQALQANTTVRSAQAALLQSRALRDAKSANLVPVVNTSASAQRSTSGGNEASNNWRAGFDASWEPDVFGSMRNALSATEADASAAETNLAAVQVSIAAEVALTYIELRGLQARLALARNNLASQTETQQITDWRVQAGLASALDLEQARAASAQTSAQIPALESSMAQAQHRSWPVP